MTYSERGANAAIGVASIVGLLSGCAFHQVRDEVPVAVRLDGQPATVAVEQAPARMNGQRLLVTVEHPAKVTLDGELGSQAWLGTPAGIRIDSCYRESVTREDTGVPGVVRSQARFRCRYPLVQPVALLTGNDRLPVLGPGGLPVLGRRPWIFSAFARSELGIPTNTFQKGVDLGVNLGLRGLVAEHLHLGGRGDVLVNSASGSGQVSVGPELGYVHALFPCRRCSIEATASYLVGYTGGLAHGPEVDLRAGVRVARTGTTWHGVEGGVGFRYLFGTEGRDYGSVVLTLSYSLMTSLRGAPLPSGLRARPAQLPSEESEPTRDEPPATPTQATPGGEPAAESARPAPPPKTEDESPPLPPGAPAP